MQIMKLAFFILTLLISLQRGFCQNEDSVAIFYCYEGGIIGQDTIRTTITKHEYKKDSPFELCYTQYSYKYQNSKDACYHFFVNGEINEMKYVSERYFMLNGASYRVYKFFYNDPNIEDEEEMYFYYQDIGVIIYKSESWGGYGRIFRIPNSEEKTEIAVLLGDKIMQDSVFFESWRE